MPSDQVQRIAEKLVSLEGGRVDLVESIVNRLSLPDKVTCNGHDPVLNEGFAQAFVGLLQIHHATSTARFSKDKFEYALHWVLTDVCGIEAELAPRGNPGFDLMVQGVRWSLKTEAAANTKANELHVSKWMEMGKGQWSDSIEDLRGLRDRFLAHMRGYERIFSLRYMESNEFISGKTCHYYELVEIPKSLMLEAGSATAKLEIVATSRQNPKPGYCYVTDNSGILKYELYFDGGTERKLQIKHLKKSHCIVHATWEFADEIPTTPDVCEQ